jgi:hypothetical protein
MSKWLGCPSWPISIGATIKDVYDEIHSELTPLGWQCIQEASEFNITGVIMGTFTTGGNTAANAFDRSLSSMAFTGDTGVNWFGFQLNAASAISKVRIIHREANTVCTGIRLEYSADGNAWDTGQEWTGITSPSYGETSLTVTSNPGAHAFWRLVALSSAGSGEAIAEAEFYDADGRLILLNQNLSYWIPPATESIGNGNAREVIGIRIKTNSIAFEPRCQSLVATPQILLVAAAGTGGMDASSLTLGGVTIAQDPATLNAGNTKYQNLRFLFEAISDSSDPYFTAFNWIYQTKAPQNAAGIEEYIYGIQKTPATNVIATGANCTPKMLGTYSPAMFQDDLAFPAALPGYSVPIDLSTGFVYFLQINARGLALATKTGTAMYGPIHACYGDHAKALASMPTGGAFGQFVSPIELIVGSDANESNTDSNGTSAKAYGVSPGTQGPLSRKDDPAASWIGLNYDSDYYWGHPFGHFVIRNAFHDHKVPKNLTAFGPAFLIPLFGSAIWTGADTVGDDYQIHRATMAAVLHELRDVGGANGTVVVPPIDIQDWYKFVGTAANENLLVIADTVQAATLNQNLPRASDPDTITLSSTALLEPTGGFVVIEGEFIQYTAVAGNTITGCIRARYGTARAAHFIGAQVYQGLWMIKANGGALFAGYVKPS